MKAVAALHRPRRLAATALATWLALARRKAAAELARRKAVRHRCGVPLPACPQLPQ